MVALHFSHFWETRSYPHAGTFPMGQLLLVWLIHPHFLHSTSYLVILKCRSYFYSNVSFAKSQFIFAVQFKCVDELSSVLFSLENSDEWIFILKVCSMKHLIIFAHLLKKFFFIALSSFIPSFFLPPSLPPSLPSLPLFLPSFTLLVYWYGACGWKRTGLRCHLGWRKEEHIHTKTC